MTLRELSPAWRLPLLLLAMLSLVSGVLGGLARLGIPAPGFAALQAGNHGALMIAAFFGTVISLERAVALHRFWPYLAPLAAGLGGLSLLAGTAWWLPPALFTLASSLLCIASFGIYRQQSELFTLTLLLGAAAWLAGNLVWLAGGNPGAATLLWMSFLVLTIAGERLELTRFLPPRPLAERLFRLLLALAIGAAVLLVLAPVAGSRLLAAAFLALAVWLLRYDIARRTVRQTGLTRFVAVCLLAGYAWLASGAALGLLGAFEPGHDGRDAALHAIFLGFVFSMVIGHAPIIFPAVMRVRIPYHPFFYLPLAALHLTLAVRLLGGLAGGLVWQQHGAALNALSLALFVLTILVSVGRGAAERKAAT
ncbi:MAG: hypothetical protein F9K30_04205 [Dechloromonas sp.]|nr:MAG: hypothetical protein F9K30_04205 [Dechloromonas sp.]